MLEVINAAITQYFMPTLIVLILVGGWFTLKLGKPKGKIGGKFKALPYLNTKAEQNFFKQLLNLLPDNYHVACKVRLADICKPSDPKNIVAFNKVSRKHVDFVIIETSTSKVLAVIELDDRSHMQREARGRDADKNYALKSAGVPLFRIKNTKRYTSEITDMLSNLDVQNEHSVQTKQNTYVQVEPVKPSVTTKDKLCPRCNMTMERVDMKWPNLGKHYFYCSGCSFQSDINRI